MFETFFEFLKAKDVEYKTNVRLADISPMGVGGVAKSVVFPRDAQTLAEVVDCLNLRQIRHKILGRMSNVLPPDDFYEGALVRTDRICDYEVRGECLRVGCGVLLGSIANRLAELGLSGAEELSGIPGSVGGLIMCNAGAYGKEISDILLDVSVYDTVSRQFRTYNAGQIDFSYRYCSLDPSRTVIVGATLRLSKDDEDTIRERQRAYREKRLLSQPIAERSLGSTFKRPSGGYASKMIDECGLRGIRIGGAAVSQKHAGFIVNLGGATAGDVRALIALVRQRVHERFGVMLEPEIEIM